MGPPEAPSPEERFTALFNRTRLPLLAYAVRRVSDPADAADVVAETYVVAWRRLEEVPPGDQARPWLFGVARRVLANHHRGERRRHELANRLRESLDGRSLLSGSTGDPAHAHLSETTDRVLRALNRLSDDDREILRLVAWEGLARDEIATAMGLSRAAVRLKLHRARVRLVDAMAAMASLDELPPPVRFPAQQRAGSTGHEPKHRSSTCVKESP